MEIRNNITLSLEEGLAIEQGLQPDLSSAELARILNVPRAFLLRRSVDARRKSDVHFIATAGVCFADRQATPGPQDLPANIVPLGAQPLPAQQPRALRPVVVGAGPAGLFAALELAEAGLCPLLIERGQAVEQRQKDVEYFKRSRVLNPASNIQFGEGGAGTFSDGKLTCGKNSPFTQQVLHTFVAAGAARNILWQAKPHIGTDVLVGLVATMRARIIACGGEVRFGTQLVGLEFRNAGAGRRLQSVLIQTEDGQQERIEADQLIMAIGHSARDTFHMLQSCALELEQKPFSIGLRIEHAQAAIDRAQYGNAAGHPALGAADYKLSAHLSNGRGVYTFCMCPGGELVAAASEEGRLCINGMSNQARDGANANAALLCGISPADFACIAPSYAGVRPDASDPLAGIAFQRSWAQAAFELGGSDWHAPALRVCDFLGYGKQRKHGTAKCPQPSYPLGVQEADVSRCLPPFAANALREALPLLDRKLHGFADANALLTGIEARSSSAVRIIRDPQTLQAIGIEGLYPCGEGAGYAGGIMSAAIDGIRCAQMAMEAQGGK